MKQEIARILAKSEMNVDDIHEIIEQIDVETGNSVYVKCSEEFNFKVVEVEGTVYSTTRELFPVLGYSGKEPVSKVLRKYGVNTTSITGIIQNGQSQVRQEFGLSDVDFTTKLIDYHGFLTIALNGKGSNCDKVREYLLSMEKKARVDTVVQNGTGFSTSQLLEIGDSIADPMIQGAMERMKNTQDLILLRAKQLDTDKRISALETTVETSLPITAEQEHILNQKRDELVNLMVTNGQNSKQAFAWFYNNFKRRFRVGVYRGIEREKAPLAIDWIDGLIGKEKAKLAQVSFL